MDELADLEGNMSFLLIVFLLYIKMLVCTKEQKERIMTKMPHKPRSKNNKSHYRCAMMLHIALSYSIII